MASPLMLRALYPHSHHLSAKVRAFVDFLVERFGSEPDWDAWCRRPSDDTPEFPGLLEGVALPLAGLAKTV